MGKVAVSAAMTEENNYGGSVVRCYDPLEQCNQLSEFSLSRDPDIGSAS